MENPKLALIPSGYKSGTVYSILPTDGVGDFDFSRNTSATRVNKDGLIETVNNNVPRLDWLNIDCPSLLLEPTRSNIQIKSEEFQSSFWTKSRTTITANNEIAPTGELTADKLTGTGTGTSYVYDGNYLSNGFDYTISIFVKPIINISSFAINIFGGVGTAYFNLVDKTVNSISGDFTSAKIVDYGNGWLRCIGTLTLSSATGTYNIGYGLVNFNGDQFYLFGAQVEQGSYVSSYIKTTSIYSTRQLDSCINGGDADLFNITEGTFFVDTTPFESEETDRITLSNNNYDNRILISKSSSTQLQFIVVSNNSTSLTYTTNINYNQRNKIIITFKQNEFKVYLNGLLKYTDTSGDIPTGLNDFSFKGIGNALYWSGKIHDTRVYDRVLTQDEAIELTTI